MSSATRTPWLRLRTGQACPACNHKGWCMVAADGASALCMRSTTGRPHTMRDGQVAHIVQLDGSAVNVRTYAPAERAPSLTRTQLAMMNLRFAADVSGRLPNLSEKLGLSEASLRRMCAGWRVEKCCWTFPMRDAGGNLTGFRTRGLDGKKYSVTGGHEGLFIPDNYQHNGRLVVVEGPTSCAAMLDMGVEAVGRPSCSGGLALLRRFIAAHRIPEVVLLSDRDEAKERPDGSTFRPGPDGAHRAASELADHCRSVKVVICPVVKDARDWLHAGGTKTYVEMTIQNAASFRLARPTG